MNYDKVPNMISGKDLDYLTDIFNWNYGAYKCAFNASNEVLDETLKKQNFIPSAEGLIKEHILDGDWTDELPSFVEEIIEKRKLKKAPFLPKDFHFYFDKKHS